MNKVKGVNLKAHREKLQKKFGKGAVVVDKELQALAAMPYGIGAQSNMINLAIGRPGFPAGRLTEIVGQEASSKSTLGYHILAECQRIGGIGVLVETEETFETSRLKKLGIKVDDLIIVQPKHMEETFAVMEMNIIELRKVHTGPIAIVWDSVASTPVLEETESEYDDNTMAVAARFLSKAMRKFIRVIAEQKIVVVFMNQLKATLDIYSGEKFVSYGGKAIKFHSSIRLWVKTRKADLETDKEKGNELVGQMVQVQNIKNKISTPFKLTKYFLNFKKGIDIYRDCLMFGSQIGIFKEVGAGRFHYKGKTFTKKTFKPYAKERWGDINKCRDVLMAKAIKKGVLTCYGINEDEKKIETKITRHKKNCKKRDKE